MGVVLDGASLIFISLERGAVVNDVALLLPGGVSDGARLLKEDALEESTDCGTS
jgi:hypothetical protein